MMDARPMRVLMTSTSYPRDAADWRGGFIHHMAAALARAESVRLRLWAPPGALPTNVETALLPREAEWLARLLDAGGISHLLRLRRFSAWFAPLTLLRMLGAAFRRESNSDIYHINWLQCALPLPDNRVPALITVLGNDFKLLRMPLMRVAMRRVMRHRNVTICPNAEWMCAELETAFGDLAKVIPVSFGIDPQWYAIERAPAWHEPLWLAVTRLTRSKLGTLFAWSEPLFRNCKRRLHLFGPMQEATAIPEWIEYHGAATPEQLAIEWFPRAHGLITLSEHAEGRPQVMLEAMAAGLPIVASRIAAHENLLVDGETGILCDSADGCATALRALEDNDTNLRMGRAARRHVRTAFGTWDDCARRYIAIYQQLLGSTTRA